MFYLMNHLPEAKKKQLKMGPSEDYTYCSLGGCTTVEGIDDEKDTKEYMVS